MGPSSNAASRHFHWKANRRMAPARMDLWFNTVSISVLTAEVFV